MVVSGAYELGWQWMTSSQCKPSEYSESEVPRLVRLNVQLNIALTFGVSLSACTTLSVSSEGKPGGMTPSWLNMPCWNLDCGLASFLEQSGRRQLLARLVCTALNDALPSTPGSMAVRAVTKTGIGNLILYPSLPAFTADTLESYTTEIGETLRPLLCIKDEAEIRVYTSKPWYKVVVHNVPIRIDARPTASTFITELRDRIGNNLNLPGPALP
ncbi:hypothetical protein DFH06DRAFT_1121254 [Mycena polygramma]|nr:hypothetical protein DFH06DRAFT_1121254 [Mycena polygramma]